MKMKQPQKRGRRSTARISEAAGDEDEVEEEDRLWPRRADSQRISTSLKEARQHPMENLFQDGDFHPVRDDAHAQKMSIRKDDHDFRRALSNVMKPEGLIFERQATIAGRKRRRHQT